jgi:bacterioferritin-associated ferredoxin
MYICVCKGITDHQIRAAAHEGVSSVDELRDCLGVASRCGKCSALAADVLHESLLECHSQQSLAYAIS